MHRRLLPWCFGLLWCHLGATWVAYSTVVMQRRRALDLEASGLFSVPTPAALADLAALPAALVAALAFTLTLGALLCGLAHLTASLVAGRPRFWRLLPLAVAGMLVIVGLVASRESAWASAALGAGALFVVPYMLFLLVLPQSVAPGRVAAGWFGGVLLLAPLLWVATPEHLRDVRTTVLALPAGEAMVNAYYRSALLAAEPVKGPRQRLHVTYYAVDMAAVPTWIRCRSEPPLLLPVARSGNADLHLLSAAEGGVAIAGQEGPVREGEWEHALAAWMAAEDPALLRGLVAIGVIGGLPLLLAVAVATSVYRGLGGYRWRTPITLGACIGIGALCAVLLAIIGGQRSAPEAVIDGAGAERIAAASARSTPLRELQRMAEEDVLLPVRAHALAQQVRRARQPETLVEAVRGADTWYQQWHGYNALLERGWDPRWEEVCP